MVHLHNRILFSILQSEIMKISSSRMELEMIILREAAQTQKVKHQCFHSFMDASFESLYMCVSPGIVTEVKKLIRNHIDRAS